MVDRGDVVPAALALANPPKGNARHPAEIAAWSRALARETYAVMREGRAPIVLGGDHALAMGSVAGVARHAAEAGRELFVLWLDAHSDYNTPLTSLTGNMHGMSAAMLCGEPGFDFLFGDEEHGSIEPGRLHLFGIRSIDADERLLLRDRGIDVVDMRTLDEHGFAVSIRRIIERVQAVDGLLHVSLDVDFLDPIDCAGRRHRGSRRGHLSRSASGDGAFVRIWSVAVARLGGAQSLSRRAREERLAARRSDGEPVRATGLRAPKTAMTNFIVCHSKAQILVRGLGFGLPGSHLSA